MATDARRGCDADDRGIPLSAVKLPSASDGSTGSPGSPAGMLAGVADVAEITPLAQPVAAAPNATSFYGEAHRAEREHWLQHVMHELTERLQAGVTLAVLQRLEELDVPAEARMVKALGSMKAQFDTLHREVSALERRTSMEMDCMRKELAALHVTDEQLTARVDALAALQAPSWPSAATAQSTSEGAELHARLDALERRLADTPKLEASPARRAIQVGECDDRHEGHTALSRMARELREAEEVNAAALWETHVQQRGRPLPEEAASSVRSARTCFLSPRATLQPCAGGYRTIAAPYPSQMGTVGMPSPAVATSFMHLRADSTDSSTHATPRTSAAGSSRPLGMTRPLFAPSGNLDGSLKRLSSPPPTGKQASATPPAQGVSMSTPPASTKAAHRVSSPLPAGPLTPSVPRSVRAQGGLAGTSVKVSLRGLHVGPAPKAMA